VLGGRQSVQKTLDRGGKKITIGRGGRLQGGGGKPVRCMGKDVEIFKTKKKKGHESQTDCIGEAPKIKALES